MSNRRHFIAAAAATAAAALLPLRASAATRHVVVIGGGMAGATLAKYLRLWSKGSIAVTLVERNATYVSNIMSNLAVTGQVAMGSLNFGYARLISKYGVNVVIASASDVVKPVDSDRWRVETSAGNFDADRVVLAPGIQMDPVPETADHSRSAEILHAWKPLPRSGPIPSSRLAE
jgi:sulfide dehydrogenase [flavocytochrome c] flavoprotein chain